MPRPKGSRNLPKIPKEEASVALIEKPVALTEQEEDEAVPMQKEVHVFVNSDEPKYERVRFVNLRDRGKPLEFFYSSKTHPYKKYFLEHDKDYDLPVEIILHLEGMNERDPNTCQQFIYQDQVSEDKKSSKSVVTGYQPYFALRRVRK